MASPSFPLNDQTWFDADNPGALHAALRADYARARALVERRPSLRRHLAGCRECAQITEATAAAPAPTAGRKRIKLVIGQEQMHRLLGLPANFEIVHMFACDDPNTVSVLIAGEGLPDTPPTEETPIAQLRDVTTDTGNRDS